MVLLYLKEMVFVFLQSYIHSFIRIPSVYSFSHSCIPSGILIPQRKSTHQHINATTVKKQHCNKSQTAHQQHCWSWVKNSTTFGPILRPILRPILELLFCAEIGAIWSSRFGALASLWSSCFDPGYGCISLVVLLRCICLELYGSQQQIHNPTTPPL